MQIEVLGKASNKLIGTYYISEEQQSLSLLDFLLQQSLPIAYSCHGNKVCEKCIVNDDKLACQYSVSEFIKLFSSKVYINYL